MKSFYTLRSENAEAIAAAITALKGICISEDAAINATCSTLRANGTSHFAIREALKVTGLLSYEDEDEDE
jgi:hypothetical protein